jgi:hypothetical protein
MTGAAPVLRSYRQLMRRAQQYGAVNNNPMWTNFVRDEFRRHASESDASRIESLRLSAAESALMFDSIHRYEDLLIKYNIGTSIDERERIRRTAARVGLAIPEWNDPPESDILKKYQQSDDEKTSQQQK